MAEHGAKPVPEAHKPTFSERMARPATPDVTLFEKLVLFDGVDATRIWSARRDDPFEAALLTRFDAMCNKRGITPPKLLIYESHKANAMCLLTGTVAVSTKLLHSYRPELVDAVLQHELTHWKHRIRSFVFRALAFCAPAIAMGALWWNTGSKWLREHPFSDRHPLIATFVDDAAKIGTLGAAFFPGKAASAAVRRHYERVADAGAVEEGYAEPLAEVLQSLDTGGVSPQQVPVPANPQHESAVSEWAGRIFATHPSTEERLENIGIHRDGARKFAPAALAAQGLAAENGSWLDSVLSAVAPRFSR